MTRVVVDASAMLQLVLPDSAERFEAMSALLRRIARNELELCEPYIFFAECAAGCAKGVDRKRISDQAARDFLDSLGHVKVNVDLEVLSSAEWYGRGRELDTQVYDGAYVALARRIGAQLATVDKRMATSAEKLGVKIYGT